MGRVEASSGVQIKKHKYHRLVMAQTVLNLESPTSTTHTLLVVLIFVILLDKLSLHFEHK